MTSVYRHKLTPAQRALLKRIVESAPHGLSKKDISPVRVTARCLKERGLIAWNGVTWFALAKGQDVHRYLEKTN